jgi:hypothetical protein
MNDNPKLQVARLDDIERRGRSIPVREHLGIHAFGVNAYTPGDDGTLISEHDESGSGQEELYVVLDGNATFEIDGETVDAPAGTLVFVPPNVQRKATGEGTVLALGATPGEAYQAIDWGEAWPLHSESMTAYREQRYADALDAVRRGLERFRTSQASITTTRASRRSRARSTTRRSAAFGDPSSCSRRSGSRRARTRTSPPYETTRGSKKLFAEREGLGLGQALLAVALLVLLVPLRLVGLRLGELPLR